MIRQRLVSLLLVVAACAAPDVPPPGELAASTKQRVTGAAPAADLDATVDSVNGFALEVARRLPATADNTAFSPLSVGVALSMSWPGARGATQSAFEQVLQVTLPQERHHRAMNTLDAALRRRGQGALARDGRPFQLRTNNQLFGQKGQAFEAAFLDVLAEEYGAGLRLLDFAARPEPSRQAINTWVSTNTERLIPELLPRGLITADTVLVLVNTLYFNAAWKAKFDKASTQPGPFTARDGAVVQVPMMVNASVELRYGRRGDVEVIELPYQGDEVALVLLVPPAGALADLEQSLTGANLRRFVETLEPRTAGIRLPKFEARAQADLKEVLSALGLGVAFSGEADFSGMTGSRGLALSAVVHEAVVKTDEDGTEAAAATAVVANRTSLAELIDVNRAFVYLVRDRATGAVLFLGRVGRP